MSNRRFTVTALRRTGQGLVPTQTSFSWDVKTRTAPQDDIVLKLMLKTVREEMPGANQPVEQVLSASWQPFELHGEWNDKFAGSGFAKATMVSFAQFVQVGPLVRLQYGPLALVGILRELEETYVRDDCVRWHVEFSPHINEQVGLVKDIASIAPPVAKPMVEHAAICQQGAADIADATATATAVPISDHGFEDALDKVSTLVAATATVVSSAALGLETDAQRKLLAIAGQFRAVGAAASDVAFALQDFSAFRQAATANPLDALAFDEFVHGVSASARQVQLNSLLAERDMKARADAAPLAVYRPKRGEDPYSISRRFYGSANYWRGIWTYNHLASMVLDGTEELVIPKRAA